MDIKRQSCWCGHQLGELWGEGYARCAKCMTLVGVGHDGKANYTEVKEEGSLYSKNYWLEKMFSLYKEMGYSSIDEIILFHYRERAAFWMQHILRYVLPPANVLEIGCGLGTLCHWLEQLGFTVQGTEVSSEWRNIIQHKLGITVSDYAVSEDKEQASKFDAIVLIDVLEHMSDPLVLFAGIANELKGDGVVMIQMPQYDGVSTYQELQRKQSSFLRYILPNEHLLLYSVCGLKMLLDKFGFSYINMHTSIFSDDMFLFASRSPLKQFEENTIEKAVLNPNTILAYAALKNWEYANRIEQSMEKQALSLNQKLCRKIVRITNKFYRALFNRDV